MSSLPGDNTALPPSKEETQVPEEGIREQSPAHDHKRVEAPCAHRSPSAAVPPDPHDERRRVSEGSGVKRDYGSVDSVTVCQSCQHLYSGNAEVVLSPSCLEEHLPRPEPSSTSNPKPVSLYRPWAARRYEGLCDCGASVVGGVCSCPSGATQQGALHSLFSCDSTCMKRMKTVALAAAAILPWVFLVTYIVLTYT